MTLSKHVSTLMTMRDYETHSTRQLQCQSDCIWDKENFTIHTNLKQFTSIPLSLEVYRDSIWKQAHYIHGQYTGIVYGGQGSWYTHINRQYTRTVYGTKAHKANTLHLLTVYVDCIRGPKDTRFYFKMELAVYGDSTQGQHTRHIFCAW